MRSRVDSCIHRTVDHTRSELAQETVVYRPPEGSWDEDRLIVAEQLDLRTGSRLHVMQREPTTGSAG